MWILGSHNSWSYLPVRKWYMKLLSFTAKCQNQSIYYQYTKYNVRCFDLRIKFSEDNNLIVAHGFIEYRYSKTDLFNDLKFLNEKNNSIYLRILHEVRNKKQYTKQSINNFISLCIEIQHKFPNLKCWCGRNLYNWEIDYNFNYYPTCEEKYSSVCSPKIIDDWWPWLYAKLNNFKIIEKGTNKEILLIDYINYGYR